MRKLTSLSWLIVLLLASRVGAQPTDADPDAMLQQMLDDAKSLAASSLPDRKQIGTDWKLPWELPAGVEARAASEDAYWQEAMSRMGFAGVSEAYARQMIDSVSQQIAAAGAGEGITARDGIVTLMVQLRSTNVPTALKVCDAWEMGARAFAAAEAQQSQAGGRPDPNRGNRAVLDLIGAQYKGLSDDQLKALYARQASLITKRTEMSYFKSNDWTGLTQVRSDDELTSRGIWLGIVKVNLMLADPNRTDEPVDLRAEDAGKLEARLKTAVRDCTQRALAMRRKEVEAKAEHLTRNGDAAGAAALMQKLSAETAAIAQLDAKVLMRQFGDNCYVVRITGVSPDTVGMTFGMYTGWLRKGEAMVEISMGGNFPEAELNKEMDRFLSEMDAKLASYDSFMYRALDVGAAPPPPPGGVAVGGENPPVIAGPITPPGQLTTPPPPVTTGGQIGIPPDDPVEYAQAMQAYNSNDMATARQLFEQALRQSPNNPRVLLMRGATRFYQNDLPGALADYKATAQLDPTNVAALRYWAFLELCVGDAQIAREQADAALKLAPNDVDALLTRGEAAMALGRAAEAQPYFNAVLQQMPGRVQSLYTEAGNALTRGLYPVAAEQFQTVLWLDPNQYGAWYGRAAALAAQGRTQQALHAYRQYLKYDQSSQFAQTARQEIERLRRER